MERDAPHLPYPAPIEAYGKGGFRFAGLSHRGSLLCLPDGIWAAHVAVPAEINEGTFDLAFAAAEPVEMFLIGSGHDPWIMPPALRARFRERRIAVECMTTPAAISTYNIVLSEGRRVGALLVAVE